MWRVLLRTWQFAELSLWWVILQPQAYRVFLQKEGERKRGKGEEGLVWGCSNFSFRHSGFRSCCCSQMKECLLLGHQYKMSYKGYLSISLFNIMLLNYYFYLMYTNVCLHEQHVCAVPAEASRGCQTSWKRSYRWAWAMWMLGIEPGSSVRAASALKLWDISPATISRFLKRKVRHFYLMPLHSWLLPWFPPSFLLSFLAPFTPSFFPPSLSSTLSRPKQNFYFLLFCLKKILWVYWFDTRLGTSNLNS